MQLDPAQLAALSAILRHGSFEAASAALHVSPPAISQRIRALEERLGGPVVTRTNPIQPTALGQKIARHADHVTLLEADLARELGTTTTTGPVRIALNADSLDTWVLPALRDLPFRFEIVVDDQSHSAEWLRRGEVSAAITAQAKPVQGCTAHRLGALRYRATASPDFCARHVPQGPTPAALATAPMLQYSGKDRLQHDWLKAFTGAALHPPTHILPSTRGFVEACLLGLGWGLNPAPLVDPLIRSGKLIVLAPLPLDTDLHWQVSRLVAAPLAPLSKAIRAQARRTLAQ